jgi:hypothetical protein
LPGWLGLSSIDPDLTCNRWELRSGLEETVHRLVSRPDGTMVTEKSSTTIPIGSGRRCLDYLGSIAANGDR